MSFTVKYITVPEKYKFRVKCILSTGSLLCEIRQYFKMTDIHECNFALLKSGETKLNEFEIFVYNQEKQGYIDIYFESEQKYLGLLEFFKNEKLKKQSNIKYKVYRYNSQHKNWFLVESFANSSVEIFGYDKYLNIVNTDLENHIKYNEFLKNIGEMKSINYLLHGPPGIGKTTFIKVIASQKDIPIFIVNPNTVSLDNINTILSPSNSYGKGLKILLFEDFDRFLEDEKVSKVMSQILNALDGFDDNGDTIRMFTANNTEKILSFDALRNRMSQIFEFQKPNRKIFEDKLKKLLSFHVTYDEEKFNIFINMILKKDITLRPFTNYIIRYMFHKDFLDLMIKNIDMLV